MDSLYKELTSIVGEKYVSGQPEERFIYSRDPGTMLPAFPDYVALPGTTEDVQKIVLLANRMEVPIVPMGGGLVLSGLCRALKGGIVLDMKRMNRILEVNEVSRYALVEAGVSQGMLQAYLKKHHPSLKHSCPDSPPIATLGGNVLIHGSGHLSATGGFHSEMLNGLEVVLPTGEVAKTGSCASSPFWFSRAPLPDLSGLFIGWAGTTGIATKLAIKLYPDRPFNDVLVFLTEDLDLVPEVIHHLSGTSLIEDILATVGNQPKWMSDFQQVISVYGADSGEDLKLKRKLIRNSVKRLTDKKVGGFLPAPQMLRQTVLKAPNMALTRAADALEGGGFEYVGSIMPIELFARAYRTGVEIGERYGIPCGMGARIIGQGHCMMFFYAYPFIRRDESNMEKTRQALVETNEEALKMGGIPWKAEAPAQKDIIHHMDPHTFQLMNRIRSVLDPKGIMNPGNWEVA